MKQNHTHQNGAALITALLITAIVVTIATVLFVRQRVTIHETQLLFNADRLYYYAQGVEDWAINQLIQNEHNAKKDTLKDPLPQKMKPLPFEGAIVSGSLTDPQGLFNINSLSNPDHQKAFISLLHFVAPRLNNNQLVRITQNITDWLGASSADDIYLRRNPPYRAAHRPMSSISELRLVQGITPQLFLALAPYISALPPKLNKININTAPAPVLLTLSPKMTRAMALSIIDTRQSQEGFKNKAEFMQYMGKLGIAIKQKTIQIQSDYFLSHARATQDHQTVDLFSLLYRKKASNSTNKQASKVSIIWQTRGTL